MASLSRARLVAALDKTLASLGEVVLAATLIRRPDPAFDPAGTIETRYAIRVALLAHGVVAPDDPIRRPGDRLGLLLGPEAPAPRPTDQLLMEAGRWDIVDVEDRSAGLALLFRATLRPLGPEAS